MKMPAWAYYSEIGLGYLVFPTFALGRYSAEAARIAKLQQHAREHGYSLSGRHHEIYLNTPERTAPEKLKTVIRHPVWA